MESRNGEYSFSTSVPDAFCGIGGCNRPDFRGKYVMSSAWQQESLSTNPSILALLPYMAGKVGGIRIEQTKRGHPKVQPFYERRVL